jgi:hypothetical protein
MEFTSLPAVAVDAARLLALGHGHWRIENGLQYWRDVTLQEDASQMRRGHAPAGVSGAQYSGVWTVWTRGAQQLGSSATDLRAPDRSVAGATVTVRACPTMSNRSGGSVWHAPPARTLQQP